MSNCNFCEFLKNDKSFIRNIKCKGNEITYLETFIEPFYRNNFEFIRERIIQKIQTSDLLLDLTDLERKVITDRIKLNDVIPVVYEYKTLQLDLKFIVGEDYINFNFDLSNIFSEYFDFSTICIRTFQNVNIIINKDGFVKEENKISLFYNKSAFNKVAYEEIYFTRFFATPDFIIVNNNLYYGFFIDIETNSNRRVKIFAIDNVICDA